MKTNRSLELTVKCYFAEDSTDVSKILKDTVLIYIKNKEEKSCDNTLDFSTGVDL